MKSEVQSPESGVRSPESSPGWVEWLLVFLCIVLLLCGCRVIAPDNIVSAKATVFGLDISNDPVTQLPHLRLGLVRYFYQRIPTATNTVFAAPYSSDVDADLGLARQSAKEKFSTVLPATTGK